MPDNDRDILAEKLQDLSQRIAERTREFREKGMLSEDDSAKLEALADRHADIHSKLDAAVKEGDLWSTLKTEFHLDIDSLFEEFTRFEKDLEGRTMRSGGS
ncbi:MAG: hypothetical protein Tsb0019_31510 [Roseibium sp.]